MSTVSVPAGVFMRVDRSIGEPVWHLAAFHTVSELLSRPEAKAES